jgi:4-carboxymuconolactone decarboxylase
MDVREAGLRLVRELIPAAVVDFDRDFDHDDFGTELSELALVNVFGRLWTRDGLDRRSRSLVTLGMLIALGASEELRIHFAVARRNGLTREELEEVVYHATGYAGFPRATAAYRIAREVFDLPGDIESDQPEHESFPDARGR